MPLPPLETAGRFSAPGRDRWLQLVEADLKGAPFERRLITHTYEGIHIQPLYTRADAGPAASGFTGLMPMTRGARVLGNSQVGWEIRQERGEADPAAVNEAIRDDLAGGVASVVLRLDACARAGLDPVDPHGAALAATDGAAAYGVDDLDRALEGVHLEMIGVCLEPGAAFLPAAALLAALWARRGVPPEAASGAFQSDPLAVLARDGHLPYSVDEGLARLADLAVWTGRTYPRVRAVRVGTAAYHHAGATATQDLAFSMATALEYLRAMTRAGLTPERAAGQVLFSYAVGCGFFLAAAKLRAARRMWARVVEACGGGAEARRMVMYARPSKRVLTTRDPWVNLLRNTACVFAAGIGGADAIASAPFDSTLGEPSALGRRIARNTHHLLMEECRLHRIADPAGGSWYIEKLTDELAQKAWVILQAIEARGGMARALADGWIAGQIDTAAQPRIHNLATRKEIVVGVSDFLDVHESAPHPAPPDRARIIADACRRLAARAARPSGDEAPAPIGGPAGERSAWAARRAAAGASIGELSADLGVGPGRAAVLKAAVAVHPFAEPFEHLREASDRYTDQCGSRPRVALAAIGPVAERLPRVNFCRNLFAAGGFEVLGGEGDGSIAAAAAAFAASGAHLTVICGSDEQYTQAVPALAPLLRSAGAHQIILAGNPGPAEAAYRAAGVDRFVFVRCDVVALLSELLEEEGVAS
ncbi:MAG: methylmalonyl-CoA mutase small subunit [Phycisphaerales bacterium]|nr:methylmalonyl-CoA mutase small subunit [Phycisphaerales bacterium]